MFLTTKSRVSYYTKHAEKKKLPHIRMGKCKILLEEETLYEWIKDQLLMSTQKTARRRKLNQNILSKGGETKEKPLYKRLKQKLSNPIVPRLVQ